MWIFHRMWKIPRSSCMLINVRHSLHVHVVTCHTCHRRLIVSDFFLSASSKRYVSQWTIIGLFLSLEYRGENKGLFVLLSRTQAGPGSAVKQEQEEWLGCWCASELFPFNLLLLIFRPNFSWRQRAPQQLFFHRSRRRVSFWTRISWRPYLLSSPPFAFVPMESWKNCPASASVLSCLPHD